MLVSKAVSENIVPGIAKALELYILTYSHDQYLQTAGQSRNVNFKIKGGKITATEGVDFTEATRPGGPGTKQPTPTPPDPNDIEQQKLDWEKEKFEKQQDAERKKAEKEKASKEKEKEEKENKLELARKAKVDVKLADNKAMSIEPSWMTSEVVDRNGYTKKELIGVKVVALRIKSDEKLSRLILHDTQLGFLNSMMIRFGRSILRRFYGFIDRWSKRAGGVVLSGDPRRDIVMGRTGHDGQAFVVLNKNEDIDEIFMSNIGRINRLFKMGWGNIIIVDDINRVAYFCMQKYKGVCMALSYAMIYHNFGKLDVYNTLEDAKRQSNSIFKIGKNITKVMAEWFVEEKRSKYIHIREDKKDGSN